MAAIVAVLEMKAEIHLALLLSGQMTEGFTENGDFQAPATGQAEVFQCLHVCGKFTGERVAEAVEIFEHGL